MLAYCIPSNPNTTSHFADDDDINRGDEEDNKSTMSSSVVAAAARAAKGAALVSLTTVGSQWTDCEPREANLRTRVSRNAS